MSYWVLSFVLVVFGFLTGFSIGAPFLLIGLAMVALGPVRGRRRIFVPVLVAVAGFCLGYALVTPLTCTATSAVGAPGTTGTNGATAGPAEVTCTSVLGGPYRGPDGYDPPRGPAFVAGISAALGAGVLAWLVLTAGSGRRPAGPGGS